MSKDDYILRSLSKITKKRWEHYVINRIYHRLGDSDIEFVCQQCIRRSDGKVYLVDLFLPQLNLYLEIDEGHHQGDEVRLKDAARRHDIAEAAELTEVRISVAGIDLSRLDDEVEKFINEVARRKELLESSGRFAKWDYERRYTAEPHLEAGYIEIGPHAAFRTHRDALRCFGYVKGHWQRGVWNFPPNVSKSIGLSGKCMVWFPKLYEQEKWMNSLSADGTLIVERNKDPMHAYQEPWDTRVVMAHSRDELNRTLYRFVGVFEVEEAYRDGNEHRFRRIATKVSTYSG